MTIATGRPGASRAARRDGGDPGDTRPGTVLDRSTWNGLSFGVALRVGAPTRSLLDQLLDRLPPPIRPASVAVPDRAYVLDRTPGQEYELRAGRAPPIRHADFSRVLGAFELDVQSFVAESAPGLIFAHAGVVGWRGRAIVIPGTSRSGKSTLVRELVRAGAEYYSDEFAVIDGEGRVLPCPRPLRIRQDGRRPTVLRCAPAELGARVGSTPLPVGLVLAVRYSSVDPPALSPLTAGEVALRLLGHAVPARARPAETMRAVRRVAETPGLAAFQGVRCAAAPFAERVLDAAFDTTGAGHPAWSNLTLPRS